MRLIAGAALLLLTLGAACSTGSDDESAGNTTTPLPDSLEAGVTERVLLEGTPYATTLYRIESGEAGPRVLVLAGLHGDEPGAWEGAEIVVAEIRLARGTVFVIPRVNTHAIEAGVRSIPELGDPNRLFPGDPDGLPMEAMAHAITRLVTDEEIDVVIDLHESWAFFEDSPEGVELAFLGQTISPHRSDPSREVAAALVEILNARLPPHESFHYHEFPKYYEPDLLVPLPPGVDEDDISGDSVLALAEHVEGLATILVEVGQQQPYDRRVIQQVEAVVALLIVLEMLPAD